MTGESLLQCRIDRRLSLRSEENLERKTVSLHRQQGRVRDGHSEYINFSGNDYLGLAQDKALVDAWQEGLRLYGAGSTASPLVSGYSDAHQTLESSLCQWLGFERALLFNSGFSANQAVLFSLLEKGDHLIQDKLNHASLLEAGQLCEATQRRFRHNDAAHLETLLSKPQDGATLVVTEGVFSMDGDLSSLSDISYACKSNGAWLMVDDAHGCGVLGKEGKGSCANAKIQPDILIVTFGKAFGMMGAAVLCSDAVHRYLTQFARHYVYSTAMPPAQAHAINYAVSMIRHQAWRREKLANLSSVFHQILDKCPEVIETTTPIKPVVIGDITRMQAVAQGLKQQGFWTGAIRPPTVPKNTARLRVTLSVNHDEDDVRALALSLRQLLTENV